MSIPPEEKWEMRVQRAARDFSYPPTPDMIAATRAGLHRHRRVTQTWIRAVAAILIALLLGMIFVPEIRAGVLEFLRVGAVRIFVDPAVTPALDVEPPPLLEASAVPLNPERIAEAERALGAPILLPAYPPDLGAPDSLSIVDNPVTLLTFVWNAGDGGGAQMVLQIIGVQTELLKYGVPEAVHVSVNGELAVWLDTPHTAEIRDTSGRTIALSWLVQSNVLAWIEDSVTYRLETSLPLADAIRIAESLQPLVLE